MTVPSSTASTGSPDVGVAPGRLVNLRDVASASPVIRPGVLLRSDAPRAGDAPPDDVAWPPATVVDLRDHAEKRDAHPLSAAAVVHGLPVLAGAAMTAPARGVLDLGALYAAILDGTGAQHLVDGVALVAGGEAPVLVHCTAGKDRTGVLVALVLALVGVERDAIVADYVRTQPNMPQILARARVTAHAPRSSSHALAAFPPELLRAPASAVEAVLDILAGHVDGAVGWYLTHGGDPGTLSRLRERLLL